MENGAQLRQQKRALRRQLLPKRAALPGRAEKDRAICGHILALPQWQGAQRILLYLNTPQEPDTRALALAALAAGKEVYAPVCGEGEGQMAFYRFTGLAQLRAGKWGIQEPPADIPLPLGDGARQLCLVPGLAFDRRGFRLGYGKGYYDRFLAAMEIESVGMCYQGLFLESLPAGPTDKRVGRVATEAGISACAQEGSSV